MFIRVLCTKRRKKETPNPLKIEGNGELKCAKHIFLYLTLIKEIREKKDRCWWEKRGANCLSTSGNEILRQFAPLSFLRRHRQGEKGGEVKGNSVKN